MNRLAGVFFLISFVVAALAVSFSSLDDIKQLARPHTPAPAILAELGLN